MVGEAPRRRPGVSTVVVEPSPADSKIGPAVIFAVILVVAAISYLAWVAFGA